jgi:hypothetical protein
MAVESLEPGKIMQFGMNLEHVGQQKQNRLAPHVDADLSDMSKGDRFTYESFGKSEPANLVADWSDTPDGQVPQFRRVGFWQLYADAKYVTSKDAAEKLIDPKNATLMAMAFGRERRRDQVILERGIFAASMQEIDQDGDHQTTTFTNGGGKIVAVDDVSKYKGLVDGAAAPTTTSSGGGMRKLTPAKIRKAKSLLALGEDDPMGRRPVLLYEEDDLQNMLTSDELTSADYAQLRRLEDGEINSWLGVQWVKVDPGLLPLISGQSDQFYTALFLPHYLQYKDQPLVDVHVGQRADKNHNWQAYYKARDAVLRKRDSAFVWIAIER